MKRIKQKPLTETTITSEEYRKDPSVARRFDVVNIVSKSGRKIGSVVCGRTNDSDICPNCGQEIPDWMTD